MIYAERKALREKHSNNGKQYCSFCYQRLNYGRDKALVVTPYPCDVIKVLDAYEEFIVPLQEKLPWAYRDWSYEATKQEPPHEINWAGGK